MFAQTHVFWVGDAIQPTHPVSSPFPPALNLSQHQGLFQWVNSSHQVARVLELQLQVFPMNIQDRFPLGLTGLISLLSKGLSRVFSRTTVHHQFFSAQSSLWSISHPYMMTVKIIALSMWTFVGKVMSLLFNMLSRFVIAFLLRSKHLLISWLQSLSTVILEPKKIKVCYCFHFFPIYLPWSDGTGSKENNFKTHQNGCWESWKQSEINNALHIEEQRLKLLQTSHQK